MKNIKDKIKDIAIKADLEECSFETDQKEGRMVTFSIRKNVPDNVPVTNIKSSQCNIVFNPKYLNAHLI